MLVMKHIGRLPLVVWCPKKHLLWWFLPLPSNYWKNWMASPIGNQSLFYHHVPASEVLKWSSFWSFYSPIWFWFSHSLSLSLSVSLSLLVIVFLCYCIPLYSFYSCWHPSMKRGRREKNVLGSFVLHCLLNLKLV